MWWVTLLAQPMSARRRGSVFPRLYDLLAAVVSTWADVVPQMYLARARLDGNRRIAQGVVRATHVAPGSGLLVLLNGHKIFAPVLVSRSLRPGQCVPIRQYFSLISLWLFCLDYGQPYSSISTSILR